MACADCERIGGNGCWHGTNVKRHGRADDQVPNPTALKLNAARLYDEQLHILLSKQDDYSSRNISEAPFGVMQGLLTRISDKFYRAINLVEKGEEARHESLEDTFADLGNYAFISVLALRGQWPGVNKGGRRAD